MDSFDSMDLTGVEADAGSAGMIKPGTHDLRVADAKWESTANGSGKKVSIKWENAEGAVVYDRLNVVNKSDVAQRIARSRLKFILIHAGHPNPNHPGDISSMVGLRMKAVVILGDKTTDKDGKEVQWPEIAKYLEASSGGIPSGPPADAPATDPSTAAATGARADDDIPF